MTFLRLLVAAVLAMLGTTTMGFAIETGQSFLCPSTNGLPDVKAKVGRVLTMQKLGVTDDASVTVHLQLSVPNAGQDLPTVGHSPFMADALEGCTLLDQTSRLDDGFDEGYDTWLAAFDDGNAGFFTINPAEAYWAMLGVLDENGALKQ